MTLLPSEQTAANPSKIRFAEHFYLVGANLERADLRGVNLDGVNLTNANLRSADLTDASLRAATLVKADLSGAVLKRANMEGADLSGADMSMSYARATNFRECRMWNTIVRHAIWKNALLIDADLTGADFVCTLLMGARFDGATLTNVRNMDRAVFQWYMSPWGGPPSYDPIPGWLKLDESIMGGYSFRENAAREKVEEYERA